MGGDEKEEKIENCAFMWRWGLACPLALVD